MQIGIGIILAFIAGIANGSFALPTKKIKKWNFEQIWLNYSFWAFVVFPWAFILFLAPEALTIYRSMSLYQWLIIIIGGALFGVGQVCFARALTMIGLSLGFVINIGLGTALGFLLPLVVFHPEKILSLFGLVTLIGTLIILFGLFLSYQAGNEREAHAKLKNSQMSSGNYNLGVILAVIAGVFSADQNFTFAATNSIQQLAIHNGLSSLASAIIIWPIFLLSAFIPYALYMLLLHFRNKSSANYLRPQSVSNIIASIFMGIFWFCSLTLYSKASSLIGSLGPVIAWPLFMVVIILTSNFWGWHFQEWSASSQRVRLKALLSILILIIAVIVLGYSATLA